MDVTALLLHPDTDQTRTTLEILNIVAATAPCPIPDVDPTDINTCYITCLYPL